MADYSELKRKAQEIKDEVKAGANTANRVGLALEETVKALEAENKRAEQAEESLENSVQMLQDETEDLPSIREQLETLVVNDLTTGGADKALSAEMGKVLGVSVDDLEERIYDLGDFGRSSQAEAKAGKADIAGNPGIVLIRYTVGNKNGIILQQVGETITNQILFWDSVYQRHINFSGSDKTSVSSTSYWYKIGATHTSYDAETRRLHLQDMNNSNLNPSIDAVLPLASETEAGLMSKEQVAKLRDAASNTDLAKKQSILKTYSESEDGGARLQTKSTDGINSAFIDIHGGEEPDLDLYTDTNLAIFGNESVGITSDNNIGINANSNVNIEATDNIHMKSASGEIVDVVGAIVSRESDGVELLENGNIKLTLKGTTKEFMPATPSGDPMHYAYETAGAEYNATTDFIVKNAPWKDMVDTIEDKAKWGFDVVDASQVKQMTIGGTTYNYVQTTRKSPEGTTEPRYFIVGQASDGSWVEDETKVLHLPGHWYLNGLGDITGKEMKKVWEAPHSGTAYTFINYKIRTIIHPSLTSSVSIDTTSMCAISSIETLVMPEIYSYNMTSMLYLCKTIKYISNYWTTPFFQLTTFSYDSNDIFNIRSLKCRRIQKSQDLTVLAYISKKSIKYMIDNATPTTPITITLHADRYAQLSEDSDIVAALEAKNTALEGTSGSISLVSA